MEESEAATTAADEGAVPGRRARLRVPTSLIATLLGIALTAWLLPAFTRQWDDRQKAHELKAALVADMASSTARALSGADALYSLGRKREPVKASVADNWSVASLQIEARLRAYFPTDVVAAWQIYSWFVDRFAQGQRAQAQAALFSGVRGTRLDPDVASALADVLAVQPLVVSGPSFVPTGPREDRELNLLTESLQPNLGRRVSYWKEGGHWNYSTLVAALLSVQEAIVANVLAAHPVGYSTTSRDLVRNLLP